MLKHQLGMVCLIVLNQPPSGGCVLKLGLLPYLCAVLCPAAFRRLCVETVAFGFWGLVTGTSRLQAAVC